jgi:hypothetical protein
MGLPEASFWRCGDAALVLELGLAASDARHESDDVARGHARCYEQLADLM